MKKFIVLTAALVFVSSSAFALIGSSAHDFTATAWTNDICAPCHTPHNAISGAGPLWSHSSSTATFTMYTNTSSATYDMTNLGANPVGVSLACLSCHDGATNMDDFIGSGSTGTTMGAVSGNLGTDLTNDHPISFTYDDTADAQSGLHPLGTAKTNGPALVFYGASADEVECGTCHDVHNGTAFASMLREDPAGSAICLDCHNK